MTGDVHVSIDQVSVDYDMVRRRGRWRRRGHEATTLLAVGEDELIDETPRGPALDRVSLDVARGRTHVVMGLSGSGKSTLLRCINVITRPTSGSIYFDGTDLTALSESELRSVRGRRIAMVFQHYALLPHRTVLGNVEFGLELKGVGAGERSRRALEAIRFVQLSDAAGRQPRQLSGGMQQRVGLARALATGAELLLLDEPLSGLDPITKKDMLQLLADAQREFGTTMVFVTHDLGEAMAIGHQVSILRRGRLEQTGLPADLIMKPATAYVERFTSGVNRLAVLSVGEALGIDCTTLRPPAASDPSSTPCLVSCSDRLDDALAAVGATQHAEVVRVRCNERALHVDITLHDFIVAVGGSR
jgi:glycine betaine/proline transport system ATP-binding protein